jgi:hypothetical protein
MNDPAADAPEVARRPHRVLLVREWDQQTTGSGCCGRLEGGDSEIAGASDFGHCRQDMEAMGAVYRALRKELPQLDVQIVDPRNLTFLLPGMLKDARRGGASWRESFRELRRGCGQGAIVVDGRVVSSGIIPSADAAVGMVLRQLAASAS